MSLNFELSSDRLYTHLLELAEILVRIRSIQPRTFHFPTTLTMTEPEDIEEDLFADL